MKKIKIKKNSKKVIIFGITGQDGSYLCDLLLKKNYKVYGITRDKKNNNLDNLRRLKIINKVIIYTIKDITKKKIFNLIKKISPSQIYYLAGQSSVGESFRDPITTYKSNNIALFYILEGIRKFNKNISLYNSASSECFGNNNKIFCDEKTVLSPVSPYGKSKSFGLWLTSYYREIFGIKVSSAILFNHESPLRKNKFVSQKIINYAKNYKIGSKKLILGDTNIYRDWGWANEYVGIIYKINSSKINEDFVIGTDRYNSLLNFVKIVFNLKNIPISMLKNSISLKRPNEINKIASNSKKAFKVFNWKAKYQLNDIAQKMLNEELF